MTRRTSIQNVYCVYGSSSFRCERFGANDSVAQGVVQVGAAPPNRRQLKLRTKCISAKIFIWREKFPTCFFQTCFSSDLLFFEILFFSDLFVLKPAFSQTCFFSNLLFLRLVIFRAFFFSNSVFSDLFFEFVYIFRLLVFSN